MTFRCKLTDVSYKLTLGARCASTICRNFPWFRPETTGLLFRCCSRATKIFFSL